jgi:hypothetical protein
MEQKDIEYNWGRTASYKIRLKMQEKRISYEKFTEILKEQSFDYNVKQLQNKIFRGTLSAGTYLLFDKILSDVE